MLLRKLLVIVSVSFLVGCQSYKKQKDTSEDMLIIEEESTTIDNLPSSANKTEEVKKDSLDPKEVLSFLTKFQKALRSRDKEIICEYIQFPLDSNNIGCTHPLVFGDKYLENPEFYRGKIIKEVFIKEFDNIISDTAKYLISNVDLDKMLFDSGYEFAIKKNEAQKYVVSIIIDRLSFRLGVSYIDNYESINEHTIDYIFVKKHNGDFMLQMIICVG